MVSALVSPEDGYASDSSERTVHRSLELCRSLQNELEAGQKKAKHDSDSQSESLSEAEPEPESESGQRTGVDAVEVACQAFENSDSAAEVACQVNDSLLLMLTGHSHAALQLSAAGQSRKQKHRPIDRWIMPILVMWKK